MCLRKQAHLMKLHPARPPRPTAHSLCRGLPSCRATHSPSSSSIGRASVSKTEGWWFDSILVGQNFSECAG